MNRMKSTLARLGIPGFKPTLRKAEEKLRELRTAEGTLLPENTREELRRDMARLRVVREQIKEIEQQRLRKLEAAAPAEKGPHAMVHLIARVIGIGIETADMLVNEILSRHLRDSKAVARYAGLTGSPDESGTVTKLGLPPELRRSLACTNIIENVMGTVRRVSRNVKYWRSPSMALRWAGAAMQEAAKGALGASRLTSSFHFSRQRSPFARQEPLHRTRILPKPRRLRRFSISDARFALFNIKRDIAWRPPPSDMDFAP